MPTTELTATPNEDMFQIFTDAFTINILNDAVFGGCAAFSCTTLCLNDEGQDFLVDTRKPSSRLTLFRPDIRFWGIIQNSTDPVQTPHSAASDHGLHCLLTDFLKNTVKFEKQNPP